MATVYLAIQENFEREVALKVMSPALSENKDFSERFLREARIVSRLVHPHIVTVHDVGIQNGHHYLSMEYIEGEELKERLPSLNGEQLIRVVSEVAKALDYAGRKGYVHRDVKPENIMIHNQDGRSVLMDFGIARAADSVSSMTQTGTALGTPHYMSPEQARGKAVDGRSDLYSLGCLFFYMLTGKVPYDADSPIAVGIKHVSAELPQLPIELASYQHLIDKLMAKDPADRFQAGSELVAALATVDVAVIDRVRPRDGSENLSSPMHTPLRSEQVKSVADSAKVSQPKDAVADTSSVFDNIVTGSHPHDALHIPREDLDDRRVKHSGSAWLILLPLFIVVLLLTGSYAYVSGKLVLPEAVAKPLSLDPVFNGRLPAVIADLIGYKQKASNEGGAVDSLAGEGGSGSEMDNEASAQQGINNDVVNSESQDDLVVDPSEELFDRISQLESEIDSQPELIPELLGFYRQALLSEPEHVEINESLDILREKALDEVEDQLEAGELEATNLSLSSALEWFPEFSDDDRYQQLSQRYGREQKIVDLLSQAKNHLDSNRLLLPKGDNAKASFDQVLALDENNVAAKQGIQKIITRYFQLASSAFKREDYDKTQRFIESGLSLNPNHRDMLLLKDALTTKQQVVLQINELLSEAKSLEQQQHWFGESHSAVKKYLQVLALEEDHPQAQQALARIVEDFTGEIDGLIAIGDYELATGRVDQALQALPSNKQLYMMQQQLISLAPAINLLIISGSEITDDVRPVAKRINADRTLYIAFDFENLEAPTTVFQAVLFDGGRSVQIAGVPVVVVGAEGRAKFRINRPVESFTSGGYHLDILLAGQQIFSHSFVIENK
jgi:serine/threonine protein kinase/tetratricopeptide (TPR) repeat protein